MRCRTPRFVTLASIAALLSGCADGHPLAPPATAADARAPTAIAAPSSAVAVAVSETRIDLQWTDNSSNETRFEILLSQSGESGQFSLRAMTGVNAVAYNDLGLQRRTRYCYQIRAVRTTGGRTEYSPSSNVTCATTPPVYVPPTAPSNVAALAVTSQQVDVTWQDNSSDETRFEISMSYGDAGGTYTSAFWASANATTFRVASLVPAREYCYRVRAVKTTTTASGIVDTEYSAYSNSACVLTPLGPPPPASGATAVPAGSASVTVGWTGVQRAGDSFRIDRSTDGGVAWQAAGTVSSGDGPYFVDQRLQSDRSVCYRVVAYNATAAAEPSNTACATPPAAPTAATVKQVEPGEFDLTWRDDSAVEDGYEVRVLYTQCGNDGGGAWYCWDYEVTLAVLPAGSTSYRLPSGMSPETDGPISVRAMKDGGYSDPATVTATTP